VAREVPLELQTAPSSTYETQYVYTGFGKIDVVRKKGMIWKRYPDNKNFMFEVDVPNVLPRCYHTEHVRVTVYSENPRVWKEEHALGETYFFKQVTQDVAT
jgi:hypothetical protein